MKMHIEANSLLFVLNTLHNIKLRNIAFIIGDVIMNVIMNVILRSLSVTYGSV